MKTHAQYSWLLLLPFVLWIASLSAQPQEQFKFSHKTHEEMGIDCSTCHTAVSESTTGKDDLLPTAETCQMCHGDEVTPPPANFPRITSYQEIFSHQLHTVQQSIECTTCHAGIPQDTLIAQDQQQLPTMATCFTCHAGDVAQVPEDCGLCHQPGERLKPRTHTASWTEFHGTVVTTDNQRQECTTCHVSESFCQDCHFGDNLVQQTHPMNWEFSHGVAARQRSTSCTSCHEQQQFCVECHEENLVLPVTHAVPGWTNRVSGGLHASSAEVDVDYCAACHASPGTDPTCLECHDQ